MSECCQGEDESFGSCQEPTIDTHEIAVCIILLNRSADRHAQLAVRPGSCKLETSLRPSRGDVLDFLTRNCGVENSRCLLPFEPEGGEQSVTLKRRQLHQCAGGAADAGRDREGLSQEQASPPSRRSCCVLHDMICFRCRANLTLSAMTVGVGFELLFVGKTDEPVT